jgi:twinkle protein
MSFDGPGSTSAPNARIPGATSGSAASRSPTPRAVSSGTATIADGPVFIHPKHAEWIEGRGIDPALIARFGICTKHEGGANWIAIPYVERGKVVNHKYRLASEKRHKMDEGQPLTLWNHDCLLEESSQPVIITEGEWDALAAMTAGFSRCVSVPNGAPQQATEQPQEAKRYEFLWRSRDLLDRVERFIIATDGDAPGRILAADLARLLGPERCMFVDYPHGDGKPAKDLNEVLELYGASAVAEVLNAAKPYPVKGLYALAEFPEPPPVIDMPVGIDGLSDLFRITLGTFSVLTGWAGHGKTSLLMSLLANALKAGVSTAIGSFETLPRPILERRLRAAIYGCPESDHRCHRKGPADELMAARLRIIAHSPRDDEADLDIETIIELARVAVLRDGIRLLILDPWNEIEHKRGRDESETDYVSRSIRMLKRFAKSYECAVWLVAHPRKPSSDGNPKPPSLYDLAGSANFANKADYGVTVHRDDLASNMIDVRVVKVRMGLPGKVGRVTLELDHRTMTYFRVGAAA